MDNQFGKKMNKERVEQISNYLSVLKAEDLGLQIAQDVVVGYAVWVRALLQNWRQGTVGCKSRGEISFSNKKPWKQKGTGRARAGSARSPLWRSGGVIFGPQPRVRMLKVNKKSKGQVLSAMMSHFVNNQSVYALNWELPQEKPSTVLAHQVFHDSGLHDKKIVVFLRRDDMKHWSSMNNLEKVQITSFDDVNAYELSLGNCIVVLQKDVNLFKDMVAKWN